MKTDLQQHSRRSPDAEHDAGEDHRIWNATWRLEISIDHRYVDLTHKVGQGNWHAFFDAGFDLDRIFDATKAWAAKLERISKPWLCWNVEERWCLIQQRLVDSVGWTPIVGFDPRVGPPAKTVQSAVVIDFNAGLHLPVLYPHFPLEFVFRLCDRLAFWHSDLLIRRGLMEEIANVFEKLKDGEVAATKSRPGLRHIIGHKQKRYWELVGCTTRSASRDQYEHGAGWWMDWWCHPMCQGDAERENRKRRFYWDHGSGIYYWQKKCSGKVVRLTDKRIYEGHFTKIGNPNYRRTFAHNTSDSMRSMNQEIKANFELASAAAKMGLSDLL